MTDDNKSLDVLGIKPVSDAVKTVTEVSTKGTASFLSRICMPAAEEFGLLMRDKIRAWRAKNLHQILADAEQRYVELQLPDGFHAHPRIAASILQHGSWEDDQRLQTIWAGLLVSSCSADGSDDSNLLLVNIASRITRLQAAILEYAATHAKIRRNKLNLLWCETLHVDEDELRRICGHLDLERIDRELDALREMELIDQGFDASSETIEALITPTSLALNLRARAHGWAGSAATFYGVDKNSPYNPDSSKPYPQDSSAETEQIAPADPPSTDG